MFVIKTYKDAREYLERYIPYITNHHIKPNSKEGEDKLGRMRHLLNLLDNPQKKFPSIVISGTSGKSSTSYLIAHMFTSAGYSTGLTISPHLDKLNERIQLGKKNTGLKQINDTKFIAYLNEIIPIIESMKNCVFGLPSYYEILIGLALRTFAQEHVSIAVIEVGIEGRYDATNLISPLIFVLTNISLDHTQLLGNTVEKIAKEAISRVKGNQYSATDSNQKQIVITGVTKPSVVAIVKKQCMNEGVQLINLDKDFTYRVNKVTHEGVFFQKQQDNTKLDYFVSLRGAYQAENATIAIKTIEEIKKFGFLVANKNIEKALKTANFQGRFEEIVLNGIMFILDGAHNPAKMRAFLDALKTIYPNRNITIIIGFKKGKDIKKILQLVFDTNSTIIVTEFSVTMDWGKNMAASVTTIKEEIIKMNCKKKEILYEKNFETALNKVQRLTDKSTHKNEKPLIVITGSLYLVGQMRELLLRNHTLPTIKHHSL